MPFAGTRRVGWLICFVLALAALGCERPTRIGVKGTSTPTFVLSGSGKLSALTVSILPADESFISPSSIVTLWQIVPESGYTYDRPIEEIGEVTYGILPSGYKQLTPEPGKAPQPIATGRVYELYVETLNAPHARGLFQIDNGKAVLLDREPPCFEDRDGKKVSVPCAK